MKMKSEFLTFPAREIPLLGDFDVLVAGGGPAGCAAAVASAREGAKTLLVEATGALGGMGTGGLVPAWTPFSDKRDLVYRGLAKKVFEETKKAMAHVAPDATEWVPIDSERLKQVYDELLVGSGAKVLFNLTLVSVEKNGDGNLSHVVLAGKGGLLAARAKVFVDCTGDADLALAAGARVHPDDGYLMPATHCFTITNVNMEAYAAGPNLYGNLPESPIHAILASGRFPLIPDNHLCCVQVGPRTIGFNAGHIWKVDARDPENVSSALIKGRKMARQYRDALAEFCPEAFGEGFLVATGALMGIRESRRVVGDYTLSLEDYFSRRSFDDEIARNNYFLDVHCTREEMSREPEKWRHWHQEKFHYGEGESHGIPYRCLLPVGLRNVLVAGRSISCEQVVQGSVRIMPGCLAMGEAAGIAAAMASEQNGDTRAVDVAQLRRRLSECGAFIR